MALPRHCRLWRAPPFEAPSAALPQVLDEVRTKTEKAGAPMVTNRGVDNPVARMIRTQLSGQLLAFWIGNRRVVA